MSRPDRQLIAWLDTPGDPSTIGGKGASLTRLARLGFRVPPGFCLTTEAFVAQAAATDPAEVEDMPAHFADIALIEPVATALATALDQLVGELHAAGFEPRFAVRSSAVGEDGAAASYAGLHETELDVTPSGVESAVRRCWASLWSPAAVAYRMRRNLPADGAAMAVVVQALVPADAAAVVFTRHPVTGREDQLVLTAVRGLGDAMVSGTVTPDTYVIDKASRTVASFEPGEDTRGTALADSELAGLANLALEVEAGFGSAVDIEAAMAGGTWFLLQARPITTGARVSA